MELPISPAVLAGDTLYIGGVAPITADGTVLFTGDLHNQTIYVIKKLGDILKYYNLDLSDLVFMNVYLKDISHYCNFNDLYGSLMTKPYPPRKLVECKPSIDGITIELTAIASKQKAKSEV